MKLLKIYIILLLSILIVACNNENYSDVNADGSIADIDTATSLHIAASHMDTTNYNNLYKLISENPDSIIKISNRLIQDFPASPDPLFLQLLASYEKKDYDSCLISIRTIQTLFKEQYNIDAKEVLEPVIHKINCEKEYRSSCKDTFNVVNYFTKSRTEVLVKK